MRPRTYARALDILRQAKLRPTRQRLALARLLFDGIDRHVTADEVHERALAENFGVSLATVYNTLHQFTAAGLLREIVVDAGRSYFDTNTSDHHHFFFERTGHLQDIPHGAVVLSALPQAPDGCAVQRIDVVVRLVSENKTH
jgi:Fur family iron response transcriptional regulator